MPAVATVLHASVPGRLRYNVQGLYRNLQLKHRLEAELGSARGIVFVSASIWTGNVLVRFEATLSVQSISRLISKVARTVAGPSGHKTRARTTKSSKEPTFGTA